MKKGLTQKQLTKGIRQIQSKSELLHELLKNYLSYKRATKNWSSCTNYTKDTLQELYQEIIYYRNELSFLQRKYL